MTNVIGDRLLINQYRLLAVAEGRKSFASLVTKDKIPAAN